MFFHVCVPIALSNTLDYTFLYHPHSEVLRLQLVHKFPECSQLLPSVSLSVCVCD